MTEPISHEDYPDIHHDIYSRTVFGFWIYLLTDFVLFGVLFASYAVLHKSTFGGPNAKDLFHMLFTLIQTLILLVSSFTVGLAGASAHRRDKKKTIIFFLLSFLLGIAFLCLQCMEFTHLISRGNSWEKSAFLSAFFTLVGTHSVHVLFGLLWMIVLIIPVFKYGTTQVGIRRLTCLRMFWQFLNIIWIFIFTFVYLMGVN